MRFGRRRLVEHRGGRGPPVDDERVAVVVAQADPADVPRLGVDGRSHVEAAEDQALVRGVELRDPLRGLEDHGVALDETALVTEPATGVALLGELLRRLPGALQLPVNPVHERLLRRHLAIDQLICHSTLPPLCSATKSSDCSPVSSNFRTLHAPPEPQGRYR